LHPLPAPTNNAVMEAEPPKGKRRWFQFGEPWGLLAKTNPRASFRSVLRQAFVGAIIGPVLFGCVTYFRGLSTDYLAIKLSLCSLSFAFIAGLCEWQIDDSDSG
jgi:hypothetical protein